MLAFEIRINNAAPMIVAADNHVIAGAYDSCCG